MKYFLAIFIFCMSLGAFGQVPNDEISLTKQQENEIILNFLIDLNEKGLEITEDSVKVSKEYTKVLNDETYRIKVFPKKYTWEIALNFFKTQELKVAFWHLINLYPINNKNKELVIKSFIAYDKLFKMDEIIVNTFYTYCFLDPEMNIIKEGKSEITRPDILEEKLRNVQEIVSYVNRYREQNQVAEADKN